MVRFLALLIAVLAPLRAQETKRTYAIRAEGRVVGYQVETERPDTSGGAPVVRFDVKSLMKLEVLGAKFDQELEQTWLLDPATRAVRFMTSSLKTGTIQIAARGELGEAGFAVTKDAKAETVLDPAKVVISPEFTWLPARGPTKAGEAVELDWFMPELGGVQRTKFTLDQAAAEVDSLGTRTSVRVYRVEVVALGMTFRLFLTRDGYEAVRQELQAPALSIERAPEAVIERLQRIDFTSGILVKTNLDLEDPACLTSVRLRAEIETTRDVTAERLNVPGQKFEGTVQDGRIEGEFEIQPRRIAADAAPPFPLPAELTAGMQAYLEPEESIESDDPAIVAKARELATGATSSLAVVERLARWTHKSIGYSIPGGGTAKRTFELRTGECGGHSRVLAAMLRALRIPARTPMGGMYVPLYGGSFGQHMWTEVWLGEALGWLPVDCTAGETTFIDAGHIRLSDGVTIFRPKAIEVLDYAPKAEPPPASGARRRSDAYPLEAGETLTYTYLVGGKAIGEEQVTYVGKDDDGHTFTGKLDLAQGKLVETTKTVVAADGSMRSFRVERQAGSATTTIDVAVIDGKARITSASPDGEREDSIAVDAAAFMLHNNCTAHFAIVASRTFPLGLDEEAKVRVLHDEQRSTFAMTLRGLEPQDAVTRSVEVSLLGLKITLHTDERGRLLRYHQDQGDVTIELQGR